MGRVSAKFDGGVVAAPEAKVFDSGAHNLRFPVYVNQERKNKDTNEYERTGNVTKIAVILWNDQADNTDVREGDIVEVEASLVEREYEKKDGSKGRALETDFVESVVVKWRKDGATASNASAKPASRPASKPSPGGF